MFKIYDDPESPQEACLRYLMNRQMFNIYDDMNRSREIRGRVQGI